MITEKEIMRMALLSKLEIRDEEMSDYIKEMENLINHIKAVDILSSEFSCGIRSDEDYNSLREDRVGESIAQEDVLSNSEGAEDGFVRLRKRA